MKHISYNSANRPSLLRKSLVLVGTVVLASVALMLSAVLLMFVLVAGALTGAFLWWKTRELRKQMREHMKNISPRDTNMEGEVFGGEVFKGNVIEGTAIRVDTKRDTH